MCIYLTLSKGTFLTTAGVIFATATFGRPKTVQIAIIAAAIAFGGTAIYALPRMNELQKSKVDPAIQGRVIAFTHGYNIIENSITGIGRDNWLESFFRAHHYNKACHSSYVQVGAELGMPGLFLFLGILYCCLRTLMMAKTDNPDDERIRRALFVLVISYMASSWMVDLGFRPPFFMFTAAVGAFHRYLYKLNEPAPEAEANTPLLPAWRTRLLPQPALSQALVTAGGPSAAVFTMSDFSHRSAGAPASRPSPKMKQRIPSTTPLAFWNRVGIIDLVIIAFMTWVAIRFWAMMIKQM